MDGEFYVPREIVQVNAAECVWCGKILRSYTRHDFKSHSCKVKEGSYFMVDGGLEYVRRGWSGGKKQGECFAERSVVFDPNVRYGKLPGPQVALPGFRHLTSV